MMVIKEELISHLKDEGVLKTPAIVEAFEKVDRADFVAPENLVEAYGDYPLPIAREQTISQPSVVAFMLELLQVKKGDRVLDVGSGSGWTTALLSQLVGPDGRVWGTEIVDDLVDFGKKNLGKYKFKNSKILKAGRELGLKNKAPFDRILVSAAAEKIPSELIDQLRNGGRLVMPINNAIWRIDKISKGMIKKEVYPGFIFVPLIEE